jgi:hypothetical protein
MKARNLISVIAIGILAASCAQNDTMLTVINPDGSCYREFTGNVDSAFMVGDTAEKNNPFPVEIDSNWKISWQYSTPEIHTNWPLKAWKANAAGKKIRITTKVGSDSVRVLSDKEAGLVANKEASLLGNKKGENKEASPVVTARREFSSVKEMAARFRLKKSNEWSNLKVTYALDKKFRWFYTYYNYREIYPKIKTFDDVPFKKYMTEEEARFWFTGKPDLLKGMNGVEAREYVGAVEDKFNKWFAQNVWNEEYQALLTHFDLLRETGVSKTHLEKVRDSVFEKNTGKINSKDSELDMEKCLNEYFNTTKFTPLWKMKDSPMKKFEDDLGKGFIEYFNKSFEYKLLMPGKVLQPNNAIVRGDTLIWKLTAYRMVYSDYEIGARSRKTNLWAFIVSGLVVILAIGSYFYKSKSRI